MPIMSQSQQMPVMPQSQEMTTTQQQYTIQLPNPEAICIMELPILRKDKIFSPYNRCLFLIYNNNRTFCINSFIPSDYLRKNYFSYQHNNIIASEPYTPCLAPTLSEQYISYLANDRPEYINLIKCYLYFAIMPVYLHIQYFARYQQILVIIGGNKSGKELFFNNIIKPIFGEEYCLEVNDELLSKKNYLEEFIYKFNLSLFSNMISLFDYSKIIFKYSSFDKVIKNNIFYKLSIKFILEKFFKINNYVF